MALNVWLDVAVEILGSQAIRGKYSKFNSSAAIDLVIGRAYLQIAAQSTCETIGSANSDTNTLSFAFLLISTSLLEGKSLLFHVLKIFVCNTRTLVSYFGH